MSPRFTGPCTLVLPVPNSLMCNVDGIGFLGIPQSRYFEKVFGLGPILELVSKKGPGCVVSVLQCMC